MGIHWMHLFVEDTELGSYGGFTALGTFGRMTNLYFNNLCFVNIHFGKKRTMNENLSRSPIEYLLNYFPVLAQNTQDVSRGTWGYIECIFCSEIMGNWLDLELLEK